MWKFFFRIFLMQYHASLKFVVIPKLGEVHPFGKDENESNFEGTASQGSEINN